MNQPKHRRFAGALSLLYCAAGLAVHGQESVGSSVQLEAMSGGPQAIAMRVERAPTLDGNVLDDAAWSGVPPATGFVQTEPDAGQPGTERTEVRVVFTNDTIYFGVVCYDRDPSSIIVTDSRRDSSLTDSDSFQEPPAVAEGVS
jgi:hypothetical protein